MRVLNKNITYFLQSTFPFYTLLVIMISVATYLNYGSQTMSGMLHYYITFGDLIRAGIYDSELYKTAGSFPMWGYGFIYAVTSNSLVIIAGQEIFSVFVIYLIDSYLRKKLNGSIAFTYFRIILLSSFPLYFFHAILWPYSFSSSFLILGLYLLVRYLEGLSKRYNFLLLFSSAVSMGISLNFRSDYLLCLFVVFVVLIIIGLFRKKNFIPYSLHLCGWLIIIIAFLAPWAIYTKKVTNHYLVNSTNAGHVLYIGLGQLPGNKWQIRPYDDDSSMQEIILSKLRPSVFSTTTYESDSLLKKEWVKKVKSDPAEYFKKCVYVFLSVFVQPFSEGDGFKQSLSRDDLSKIREDMRKMNFIDLLVFFREKASSALFISILTALFGIFIHLAFWYYLIKNSKDLVKLIKASWMISISLLVILYQIALLTAGYYHRNYNTNIYLLYIIVLILLYDHTVVQKKKLTEANNLIELSST